MTPDDIAAVARILSLVAKNPLQEERFNSQAGASHVSPCLEAKLLRWLKEQL